MVDPPARAYAHDATLARGVDGRPDAVVLPGTAEEVARTVGWCYDHGVPIVPRGGGTGLAGGAVPVDGGVVLSLERVRAVRSFDPLAWRIQVEAGITTADLRRRAREAGLVYPPDPGAADQSQIGGNIATNAGGPHAFKYGVTGAWVTGLEVVLPPGELVSLGGPVRKDAAGYDLKRLLIGSEGTLGVITAAWLRLIPAPEAELPVVGLYPDVPTGCAAIAAVLGTGLQPATLEYLDHRALAAASVRRPFPAPAATGFVVIAEADGSAAEAARLRAELVGVLDDGALGIHAPLARRDVADLWRWRAGVSQAVTARRGGKLSEDIVVPVDRLADAIQATLEIGARHDLETCSWGHAGDGNLHSTFMIDPAHPDQLARAERAAADLFELAVRLDGSISGEHGIGRVKAGRLRNSWPDALVGLHQRTKAAFDPKGLMNPQVKLP
ncbi:MAG TPA: FAD-linked oxidase C-terminal domain-containing protein [Solirubrobacteraceae bacterium]|nr:FAD-linked oxidase C-terminal domain-containing protein [Solirubrobacteraceae bacterium]